MGTPAKRALADVDSPRPALRGLGDDDGEDAVTKVGGDAFGVNCRRQRKRSRKFAVPAFDLMILLARDARVAPALQRDPAVVDVDPDLLPRQAW